MRGWDAVLGRWIQGSWLTGCVSQQCAVAAEMANQLLWCINHRVHSQLEEVIVVLCLVLAHPHLEYCVQSGLQDFKKGLRQLSASSGGQQSCEKRLSSVCLYAWRKVISTSILGREEKGECPHLFCGRMWGKSYKLC